MAWVHAISLVAKVVKLQTLRNLPVSLLIAPPMSAISPVIPLELAVTGLLLACFPLPASARKDLNLMRETLNF
jgi:hypothetical protein